MKLAKLENEVKRECLEICENHPNIIWAKRMNTGVLKGYGGKPVRFGFVGLSDIIGQVTGGVFFAWEVKRPGERPSTEQMEFLKTVAWSGGFCGWSDNAERLLSSLNDFKKLSQKRFINGDR